MKKLFIVLILLLSSSFAHAQRMSIAPPDNTESSREAVPLVLQDGAKIYLTPGQVLLNQTVNANGYMHGIEMNVPGTAYLINVGVENAGTGFVTADQRHGDGRGIVASVPGAHIIVTGGYSNNNSEDGYRATNGGKITIIGSEASGNGKLGFFVGAGSDMVVTNGDAHDNIYGAMGANSFLALEINGGNYYNNSGQGVQVSRGEEFTILNATINDNGSAGSVDFAGGIAVFSVGNVEITDTVIKDNFATGVFVESNTTFNDQPVRVNIEGSTIMNNGTQGIFSFGDSQVSITSSTLEGLCVEAADATTGLMGIITVDGVGVDGSSACP